MAFNAKPALREVDVGSWAGRSRAELDTVQNGKPPRGPGTDIDQLPFTIPQPLRRGRYSGNDVVIPRAAADIAGDGVDYLRAVGIGSALGTPSGGRGATKRI